MARWYRRPKSAISKKKSALPNTEQRLQISVMNGPWSIDEIHDQVKPAFPNRGVDYTVFGDTSNNMSRSVRRHKGEPRDIVLFGVEYGESHRTYDDIIVDGRDTPVTTHWFDEEANSKQTETLGLLEELLTTINISRLGRKTGTGRYLSPYQRDIYHR